MQRTLLIVNPIAGRGAVRGRLDEIEHGLRRLGRKPHVAATTKPGDARQVAASAEDGDLVVVAGGDGTLNEVVNGLAADCPVAVFPLGTANVLAKEFRLPREPRNFCQMVQQGRQRLLDLGTVQGRRFVSMAGAGFDAEVAASLAASRSGGIRMRRYVRHIARCLFSYDFPRITVSIGGHRATDAAGFVLVSNVRSYGGPFVIAPRATAQDGLLDVCALRTRGLLGRLGAMLAFMAHCPRLVRSTRYFRARSATLASDAPVRYQVDGDPAGHLPATFELLDRKLRLIVP